MLRHLIVSERGLEAGADLDDVERRTWLRLHHGHQSFAELSVGNAEHGAIVHARQGMQHRLDFGWVDVDAARDHHVALAITDEDVAVLVDVADIAGGDESLAVDLAALLRLVVVGEVRIAGDA